MTNMQCILSSPIVAIVQLRTAHVIDSVYLLWCNWIGCASMGVFAQIAMLTHMLLSLIVFIPLPPSSPSSSSLFESVVLCLRNEHKRVWRACAYANDNGDATGLHLCARRSFFSLSLLLRCHRCRCRCRWITFCSSISLLNYIAQPYLTYHFIVKYLSCFHTEAAHQPFSVRPMVLSMNLECTIWRFRNSRNH